MTNVKRYEVLKDEKNGIKEKKEISDYSFLNRSDYYNSNSQWSNNLQKINGKSGR